MLVGAMILGCPLVIATQLRPAVAGLGTHQQLGLPPCTVRVLWGVRCPACGMTTSWAHLVRGQLVQSIQSNAGGTAFGLITLAVATILVGHAVVAQAPSRRWAMVLVYTISTAFVITIVDWSWRLASGG